MPAGKFIHKRGLVIPRNTAPVGPQPNDRIYYNPDGTPYPPQGPRDDTDTYPWRLPISNPNGGIPREAAGIDSHNVAITRQQFVIPSTATAYAIDSDTADANGNLGNIVLSNIVPAGRKRFVPVLWTIGISTSEAASGNINLTFQSLTAIIRRISNGDILWAFSSDAPSIAQFYVGMDIPLPSLDSDWYVPIDSTTDNFYDQELAYSAVFKNSTAPHTASIYGTLQYDVQELLQG